MAQWAHTYREQAIPGPTTSGIITEHKPGQKLAKAVTEIQERSVVEYGFDLDDGIVDRGSDIVDNRLTLRLGLSFVPENVFTGSVDVCVSVYFDEPSKTLKRSLRTIEYENGFVTNVGEPFDEDIIAFEEFRCS